MADPPRRAASSRRARRRRVERRRDAEGHLHRRPRPEHVAPVGDGRQPLRARDRQRRAPGVGEDQLHGVGVHRPHAGDERDAGSQVVPDHGRDVPGLLHALGPDLHVEVARPDLAVRLVLQAREKLAQDPEARGHDPGRARSGSPRRGRPPTGLAADQPPERRRQSRAGRSCRRRRRGRSRERAPRCGTPRSPRRRAGRRSRSPRTSRPGRRTAREGFPAPGAPRSR